MTAYVLDTSVISQLSPARSENNSDFAEWVRQNEDRLFVPTIVVTEIVAGIAKLHRAGGLARALKIDAWLRQLVDAFGDRVLPLDSATAVVAGQMSDAAMSIGRHPGLADVLIAASARMIDAGVLTRNLRHFEALGVAAFDPFAATPSTIGYPFPGRPRGSPA